MAWGDGDKVVLSGQPAKASWGQGDRVVATGAKPAEPSFGDDLAEGFSEPWNRMTSQLGEVVGRRWNHLTHGDVIGMAADLARTPADSALFMTNALGVAGSPITAPIHAASRPVGNAAYSVAQSKDKSGKPLFPDDGTPFLSTTAEYPGGGNPITPLRVNFGAMTKDQARDTAEFYLNAMASAPLPGGAAKSAFGAGKVARGIAAADDAAHVAALRMAKADLQKAGPAATSKLARNPNLTAAEAAGPSAMQRVKVLGEMQDLGVGDEIAGVMSERAASAPNRVNRAAERITGTAPEAAEANVQAATQAGQKRAEPLYQEAYSQQVDTPALRQVLQRPALRKALGPAAENLLNADRSPFTTRETLDLPDGLPSGNPDTDAGLESLVQAADGRHYGLSPSVTQERVPTVEHLDHAKRVLDAQITDLMTHGDRKGQLHGLVTARDALVRELKSTNPAYAKALDTSADYLKNKTAFDAGYRQFTGSSLNGYREYVDGLSRPEKESNLAGILSEFNTRLNDRTGRATELLNNVDAPDFRRKLSIAAGHISPNAGVKLHQEMVNAREIRGNALAMMPKPPKGSRRAVEQGLMSDAGAMRVPTGKGEAVKMLVDMVADPARKLWYRTQMAKSKPVLETYARLMIQRGDLTMDQINSIPDRTLKDTLVKIARGARAAVTPARAGVAASTVTRPALSGPSNTSGQKPALGD